MLRAYTLFERTQVKLIHAVACFMTCSQMARFAAVAAPLYDRKPVVKREIYYQNSRMMRKDSFGLSDRKPHYLARGKLYRSIVIASIGI